MRRPLQTPYEKDMRAVYGGEEKPDESQGSTKRTNSAYLLQHWLEGLVPTAHRGAKAVSVCTIQGSWGCRQVIPTLNTAHEGLCTMLLIIHLKRPAKAWPSRTWLLWMKLSDIYGDTNTSSIMGTVHIDWCPIKSCRECDEAGNFNTRGDKSIQTNPELTECSNQQAKMPEKTLKPESICSQS